MEIGQECFTENGRKAEYAGKIGGQEFVRILFIREDDETGPEEWASDKLTPVSKVYATAPTERIDARVSEALARLSDLQQKEVDARASLAALTAEEKAARAAATKFPQVQTALDFLEGRITHVVIEQYGNVEIATLEDALTYREDGYSGPRATGMKLLCLFGQKKGEAPRWAINRYYDGSGLWTIADPFRSEADARAEIQRRADDAFAAWKIDGKSDLPKYIKAGATVPQEYHDNLAAVKAEQRAKQVAKLRADIAALEAEQ